MEKQQTTHTDKAAQLLAQRGILRVSEFNKAGIARTTVSRLVETGRIVRVGRGIYQLSDAAPGFHHSLALAAKRVPRGVICLSSALSFHELTDRLPNSVYVGIGARDRLPNVSDMRLKFVRFPVDMVYQQTQMHQIDGVSVRITTPARTIVDLFAYSREGDYQQALEGLSQALRRRMVKPAEIAKLAQAHKVWDIVRPYLEAMTVHG
jgi:predicted transcriptional regulator of viral defense system